ncbi:MAG: GFA family protein [Rhodocyclales bacterium]|nr:GFA family protein [Rhodocyclales bacterium]MBI5784070.1 GFA family protein [Rhodocyclales bacterium]
MNYKGSCHCGAINFEVEGDLHEVADCNCSICSRLGTLLWFVPRDKLRVLTPQASMATYTFGTATITRYFCPKCGVHAFGEGNEPKGNPMAAINVRCLEGVDFSALSVKHYDGKSL